MVKDIDGPRKRFLMDMGDTVYLQGNAKQIRSKHSYAPATVFTDEACIDFLLGTHGKIINKEDCEVLKDKGEAVQFKCGMRGMLLAQHWYEYLPKKDEEELENTEPEEGEKSEMRYSIYCFLMVEEQMVLVNYRVCTKVHP